MRNGIHCLLAKDDRSDEWMCFVGFDTNHPLHSVGFHKTKAAALYRYRAVNICTNNKIWNNLSWLGCSEHPYSESRTMNLLNKIVDEIAGVKEEPKSDDDEFTEMLDNILDMVDLI